MDLQNNALVLSLLSIALGASSAVAAEAGLEGLAPDVIVLNDIEEGDLLAQGTDTEGACEFEEGQAVAHVGDEVDAVRVTSEVTEDCQLVVTNTCIGSTACGAKDHDPANPEEELGDKRSPESPENDVTIEHHTCDGTKGIHSTHWTEGHINDDLTKVEVWTYFGYGCDDGTAEKTDFDGECWWFSGNDWQNNYCDWEWNGVGSGGVEQGIEGEFECHNGNFCSDTDYLHTLYTDGEGYNDGSGQCQYVWSGELPPQRETECVWTS